MREADIYIQKGMWVKYLGNRISAGRETSIAKAWIGVIRVGKWRYAFGGWDSIHHSEKYSLIGAIGSLFRPTCLNFPTYYSDIYH